MKRFFVLVLLLGCTLFLQGCYEVKKLYPVDISGARVSTDGWTWSETAVGKYKGITVKVNLKSVKNILFIADVVVDNSTSETILIDAQKTFFLADNLMFRARKSNIITLDGKTTALLLGGYTPDMGEKMQELSRAMPGSYEVENYGSISFVGPSSPEKLQQNAVLLFTFSETPEARDFQQSMQVRGMDDRVLFPNDRITGRVCFFIGDADHITYPVHLAIKINDLNFYMIFHDNPKIEGS